MAVIHAGAAEDMADFLALSYLVFSGVCNDVQSGRRQIAKVRNRLMLTPSQTRYAEYLLPPHPSFPVGLPVNQPTLQISSVTITGLSALGIPSGSPPVVRIRHAFGMTTSIEDDLAGPPQAELLQSAGGMFSFKQPCLVIGDAQWSLVYHWGAWQEEVVFAVCLNTRFIKGRCTLQASELDWGHAASPPTNLTLEVGCIDTRTKSSREFRRKGCIARVCVRVVCARKLLLLPLTFFASESPSLL